MPKYEVPEPEKGEDETAPIGMGSDRPTVYFPANKEILGELEIGRKIEILSTGKVTALQSSKHGHSFDVELESVEVYSDNEFDKMTREDED